VEGSKRRFYAFSIFGIAFVLSLLGILFVYTGSWGLCVKRGLPPYAYAGKQAVAFLIGVIVCLLIYKYFDYRTLASNKKFLWGTYLLANLLLLSVLLFGKEINNSKSWIVIGGISFQPSEIAKILVIVFVSCYIKYKWYQIQNSLAFFVVFLVISFIPVFLILLEKDLGSAMILSIVIFAILFITGFGLKYLLYPAILGGTVFALAIVSAPYRLARIKILLHPENYLHVSGKYSSYQLVQSFVAFAKGGITGMGVGQGVLSKYMFLSLSFSDFMFAHIGEEAGFLGAFFVIIAYFFILYLGVSLVDRTDEKAGKFIALGLTLYIFLQGMVHIGVNLGLLPTTGITLPFMSLGGTSMISSFIAVGLLMNIARFLPSEHPLHVKVLKGES